MADTTLEKSEQDKPRIQSAARAIEILQLVARSGASGLTAKEISTALKVPRQVVYHLAHTLVTTDMLRKGTGHSYVLGIGVAALAQGFARQTSAPQHLQRYVNTVASALDGTAFVKGWMDDEVVTMAIAKGNNLVQVAESSIGVLNDLHARASGKLLLAMRTDDELLALLRRRPMTRRTPNTIITENEFMVEISNIRKNWLAFDRDEYELGMSTAAVPLGRAPSQMVLGVSMPTERFAPQADIIVASLRSINTEM